jgi:hypothetical protein
MGTVKVPSVDVTDTELFDLNVVLKLPVLIDRLSDMEQDQMTDIRASIHGRGSYQLTGHRPH